MTISEINSLKILSKSSGIIFLLCMIFKANKVTCYISAIFFIIYIFNTIIFEKSSIFFKYLNISIFSILFLTGTFICDNFKIWLGEINETTYYVGAFNVLVFYYWFFYTVLSEIDPFFSKITKRKAMNININDFPITRFMYKHGSKIVFVSGTILFLLVLKNPSFSGDYENRFDYALTNMSRFINIFRVFPPLFSVLLVGPILNCKMKLKSTTVVNKIIVPYIPYILFLIWTGNKFGAFVELIYLFAIPILARLKINIRTLKKVIKYLLLSFIGVSFLLFLYYHLKGNTYEETLESLGVRAACQGELWWKLIAYDNGNNGINWGATKEAIMNILNSIRTESSIKNYGVYQLMDLLGAPAVVAKYGALGTRFTASGIELPYYCIGDISLIIMPLLYCPLVSWIINVFINSVKEERFIAAIASGRLMQITVSAIQQGDWYMFFSTVSLVFIVLLLVSQVVTIKKKTRKMIKV